MSSLWPTRRHDIKLTRLFMKKHGPQGLETLDHKSLTREQKLNAMYPWLPPLVQRFRKEHKNRDWMVTMLKAIDAVLKPHFKNNEQAASVSQSIVDCLRNHVAELKLEDSFDTPANPAQNEVDVQ